jgi:hypothetical protein
VFAIPGLVLLILVDYFKPQEYLPFLAGIPLLYIFTALTVGGFLVDLRLGLSRLTPAPHLVPGLLLVAWALLTNLQNGSAILRREALVILVPFSLYLLIGHVVQTFRALQVVVGVSLVIGLGLAAVGIHQGFAPWGCHRITYVATDRHAVFDGRPCDPLDRLECGRDGVPGADYVCERAGLFGTSSVGGGRVRFRGTIGDPNELALFVCLAIPMAFAFVERRRSAPRILLLVATVAMAGTCAVLTRSRGGQLVFLAVLGVYFAHRFGVRGVVAAAACALPILLLGGRDTEDAAASTEERLDLLYRGVEMFRGSPALGVGLGQFTEHAPLTAHNSFLLTAAELGLPGMALWTAVLYLAFKIPLQALRAGAAGSEPLVAPVGRAWALAILAALTGMTVGMLFLSYAYKEALWAFLGVTGALHQAIRRHAPSFRVRFGLADVAVVLAVDVAMLVGLALYTRLKLGA